MSDSNLDCWICGEPSDRWELVEARLCPSCRDNPADSLRRAGVEVRPASEGADHDFAVVGPARIAPQTYLVFGPETMMNLLTKVLKPEVEVGERQWDNKVYLEYAESTYVPMLQAMEVNGLIERLVDHGRVELCNERALVALSSTNDASRDDVALLVASLMHAIKDFQD